MSGELTLSVGWALAAHAPVLSPTLFLSALMLACGVAMLLCRRRVRPMAAAAAGRTALPRPALLGQAVIAVWYVLALLFLMFGAGALAIELVMASGVTDPQMPGGAAA